MIKNVGFYVSGHGFGHAARAAEVLKAISEREPEWNLYIRTAAPRRFFRGLKNVHVERVEIDPGVVEQSTLHIDAPASLERAKTFVDQKHSLIAAELGFIKSNAIELLLSDIPFIVGDLAELAEIATVAIGNF